MLLSPPPTLRSLVGFSPFGRCQRCEPQGLISLLFKQQQSVIRFRLSYLFRGFLITTFIMLSWQQFLTFLPKEPVTEAVAAGSLQLAGLALQ